MLRPILNEGIGRFPERLKKIMSGKSAREFAREIGFSDAAIRDYLRGVSYPSLDRLDAIAAAAKVSAAWLATGKGPMRPGEGNHSEREANGKIPPELAEMIVKSMIKNELIKKDGGLPIRYFVRVYNQIANKDATPEAVDVAARQLHVEILRQHLAHTQAVLDQPNLDEKYRQTLESMREFLTAKIAELEGEQPVADHSFEPGFF